MNRREAVTIAVVAMMLSLCIYGIVASPNKVTYHPDIHTTAVGKDQYYDYIMDVDYDTFMDAGYRVGDYVWLSWDDKSVLALVTTNYVGLYTFEYFVNIEPEGLVTMSCQFARGSLDVGDRVTVAYAFDSHRQDELPKYWQDVSARQDWMTDEQFANLHEVTAGTIKEGILYRSYGEFARVTDVRSGATDSILGKYGFNRLICLNASEETIRERMELGIVRADNGLRYLDEGKVFARNMSILFMEDNGYREVFEYIADNDGPYLIFCSLGKDRTGFVCTVLEALMGATYGEMFLDYAESYINLYGVERDSPEFEMLYYMFDPILAGIHDRDVMKLVDEFDISLIDVSGYDYQKDAENFLIDDLGMSPEKVEKLKARLSA